MQIFWRGMKFDLDFRTDVDVKALARRVRRGFIVLKFLHYILYTSSGHRGSRRRYRILAMLWNGSNLSNLSFYPDQLTKRYWLDLYMALQIWGV